MLTALRLQKVFSSEYALSVHPLMTPAAQGLDCSRTVSKDPSMSQQEALSLHQVEKSLDVHQSCLTDSRFVDVNLANASFDNINFANTQVHNANMSHWRIEDANLTGLVITNADLRGASISHCLTAGMTIDGIAVEDLVAAYRAANAAK
jgi:uncharacterized protein YjbI with pentapeptide repeats